MRDFLSLKVTNNKWRKPFNMWVVNACLWLARPSNELASCCHKLLNKDGRLIRADYVFAKPRLAACSNIISLIKRLAVYSFFLIATVRS